METINPEKLSRGNLKRSGFKFSEQICEICDENLSLPAFLFEDLF